MYAIQSTRYSNYYIIINQAMNIKFITNLLIKDDIFKPQPNFRTKNIKFTNLFYTGTIKIVLNKFIYKYL